MPALDQFPATESREVPMKSNQLIIAASAAFGTAALLGIIVASAAPPSRSGFDAEITRHAQAMLEEGRNIFRYDTFGSEAFWGDALQFHKAIPGEKNRTILPRLSP